MFCQIRISDVLRLIKFQFYGRFRPYEQFVSRDLFPRTIHLEIPYGCTGIRTEVFGSCFCDNLRWQRRRVRRFRAAAYEGVKQYVWLFRGFNTFKITERTRYLILHFVMVCLLSKNVQSPLKQRLKVVFIMYIMKMY